MNGDLKKTFVNEPIFVSTQDEREQARLAEAEKEKLIRSKDIDSFGELYKVLFQIGSLTDSQGKVHQAQELVDKIEGARGLVGIRRITRNCGLRDKVIELLNLEKK